MSLRRLFKRQNKKSSKRFISNANVAPPVVSKPIRIVIEIDSLDWLLPHVTVDNRFKELSVPEREDIVKILRHSLGLDID